MLPLLATCTIQRRQAPPAEVDQLDAGARFLKVHTRSGELYVLDAWSVDQAQRKVYGRGPRYDEHRRVVGRGPMIVPLADVALFETNTRAPNSPIVASMTLVTVGSVALSAVCLANPKSCFGSCPTFYVEHDGDGSGRVAAEAFSASVSPSLEARDVDALHRARPSGRSLRLRVTNEALETHVIRQADLLVAPRPAGGRVLAGTDGRFWTAPALRPPVRCAAAEGSCLPAVQAIDDHERASASDPQDLAARETIELEFAAPGGPALGLVIEARQTFITTFLLYQALGYMGRQAGSYLAALERGDAKLREQGASLFGLLGDIEVQAPDGRGGWRRVGGFAETGPIARDLQVVPLPAGVRGDRLRLRVTRGHWRIGHVALAALAAPVTPQRVRPGTIHTVAGDARAAGDWLAGRQPALVTGPGDEHRLRYELPADAAELELFLDSRGYYLEWMREPWLGEESAARLVLLFNHPQRALRDLAPAYKRLEPEFEALFWRSRYARPAP